MEPLTRTCRTDGAERPVWNYKLNVGPGGPDGSDDFRANVDRIILTYADQYGTFRYRVMVVPTAGHPAEYRAERIE